MSLYLYIRWRVVCRQDKWGSTDGYSGYHGLNMWTSARFRGKWRQKRELGMRKRQLSFLDHNLRKKRLTSFIFIFNDCSTKWRNIFDCTFKEIGSSHKLLKFDTFILKKNLNNKNVHKIILEMFMKKHSWHLDAI